MADHKVRHSAWEPLTLLAECGINPRVVTPGPDGWHSAESVAKWIADQLNADAAKRGITPKPDAGTTGRSAMTPQAAYDSGRITAKSRTDWEQRYAADPAGTAATLASLAPVWDNAAGRPVPGPLSAEEELDILDDALFGAGHSERSRQRQRDRETEQAITEYRAIEQAERDKANEPGLTDDEHLRMFGQERDSD
ncbi:hypothetical protein OHB24_27160 [Kribbella sp. NBC_00482]|uniref:hypothetical protein n=1 Tax=Kribbella sp. NBC_00482 TaxID=2975968 RepID=UPI002E1977B5